MKINMSTVEEQCEKAFEKLEILMGSAETGWDGLSGDCDDDLNGEMVFKTMSNGGVRDNEFADNIEHIFIANNIPFKKGLQHRVFIVKTSDFLKINDIN